MFLPQFFPDRFVRKLLGKLLVKCFNSGCNWTGAAELLKEHIILCAYAKVQCQTCEDWFSVDEVRVFVRLSEEKDDVSSYSNSLKPTVMSVREH